MSAEGRSSRTDYTVLGCLSMGPMSGYDVRKLITQSVGHFWNESFGQIYPSLHRLKSEGLIRERGARGTGKRERREYEITAAGLEVLRAWLVEPAQPDIVRYETSLKLFFGGQMAVADARAHVKRYRERQASQLAAYLVVSERLERVEEETPDSPGLPYWSIVLDGGIRYARMALEWCDATIDRLDALDDTRYPAGPPGDRR